MPTPQTTVFRPESVSKGGTCKMNLRDSNLYDYADSNAVWTSTNPLSLRLIPEQTSWSYFLPRCIFCDTTDLITRNALLSTKTGGFTVMFRFYTDVNANPGATGTSILFNGNAPTGPSPPFDPFWCVFISGSDEYTLQFQFLCIVATAGTPQSITITSENIQAATWYHVAFTISEETGGKQTARGYINGINTVTNTNFFPLGVPTGSTRLGNGGQGQSQSFLITDLVVLEKVLTSDEILAYSLSAYI